MYVYIFVLACAFIDTCNQREMMHANYPAIILFHGCLFACLTALKSEKLINTSQNLANV